MGIKISELDPTASPSRDASIPVAHDGLSPRYTVAQILGLIVAGDVPGYTAALAQLAALGTASTEDVGTGAGNVVQLDGAGRLPPVDGSQVTGISAVRRGHIFGLTLSNNSTDATNDIDIAAGEAASDDASPILITLASGITKRLDAAWAVGSGNGGLDTGSIANRTYHVWLIRRSDTGVVDVLFSTSATSPTMPTNYDQKRRIGAIIRASGAIRAFSQQGDEFLLSTPLLDLDVPNPGTSAVLGPVSTPTGIKALAIGTAMIVDASSTSSVAGIVTSPDQTDTAPVIGGVGNLHLRTPGSGVAQATAQLTVRTDTSNRIRYRLSASDAGIAFRWVTFGWVDRRGAAA